MMTLSHGYLRVVVVIELWMRGLAQDIHLRHTIPLLDVRLKHIESVKKTRRMKKFRYTILQMVMIIVPMATTKNQEHNFDM